MILCYEDDLISSCSPVTRFGAKYYAVRIKIHRFSLYVNITYSLCILHHREKYIHKVAIQCVCVYIYMCMCVCRKPLPQVTSYWVRTVNAPICHVTSVLI